MTWENLLTLAHLANATATDDPRLRKAHQAVMDRLAGVDPAELHFADEVPAGQHEEEE